jgi:isopentenyl diphosphate isomerase/L-lactate dehydrogenase-like FMN-dependent dehydrogenase
MTKCSCCLPLPNTGHRLAAPILFAPMAQQRLCHPDGELAMARAAAASGLPYILSTMATSSIQEVADAVGLPGGRPDRGSDTHGGDHSRSKSANDASSSSSRSLEPPTLWFQIYVLEQHKVTEWMVRQVTEAGYTALVVTVDAPRLGAPGLLGWPGGTQHIFCSGFLRLLRHLCFAAANAATLARQAACLATLA